MGKTKATKKQPKLEEPKDKILRMLTARDCGKAAYAESDRLLEELIPLVKLGERIDLGNGEYFELVDPFEDGKKKWKPVGVGRWDYKVTRAPKRAEVQPAGTPAVDVEHENVQKCVKPAPVGPETSTAAIRSNQRSV